MALTNMGLNLAAALCRSPAISSGAPSRPDASEVAHTAKCIDGRGRPAHDGAGGRNMGRARKAFAGLSVALVVAGACTSDSEPAGEKTSRPSFERGGTLRVGMPLLPFSALGEKEPLDPQRVYSTEAWSLFRCCLLRTLFSYPGRPTEDGGSELRPDLAAAMPEVSRDGLTWIFRLKDGLRYAPPFQDAEIVAQDFIRALEREGNKKVLPDGVAYDFYYSAIEGFDGFRAGEADSIAGLEAPDDHTLVVHLTEPAGDFAHRFVLAATAPIPEGAAEGHDADYGRFLVASGPYMLEGSEEMDFSLPPREQVPASGLVPKKTITLVRNPSWDPDSDALRPAYVDRIEIILGPASDNLRVTEDSLQKMSRQMDAGTFDLLMYQGPWPQAPLRQLRSYQRDPELRDQVFVNSSDAVWYISMNTAVPPFDDVHVRKALNLIVDKAALRERDGGSLAGRIAGHIVLESLTNNLLLDYDPYATPGHRGDVDAARVEMARSSRDRDGDGRCDGPSCTGVVGLAFDNERRAEQAAVVRDNLEEIGIDLDVRQFDVDTVFGMLQDPTSKVALGIGIGWAKDFINGSNFFIPLFDRASLGGNNISLLGATPKQLEEWGYDVTSVPSIDDKIQECLPLVGLEQVQCWAEADQLLMEKVVPWVPYLSESHVQTVSSRVASYSFDQFTTSPALERIALRAET
jgi:peptide/nickel transport system substrate-binding protein